MWAIGGGEQSYPDTVFIKPGSSVSRAISALIAGGDVVVEQITVYRAGKRVLSQ